MIGRPASSKSGFATFDSPEKAGPTMPMTELSSMACLASAGAWSGLPWLSNFFISTWQSGLLALN